MTMQEFDVVVLGAGPGGYVAAIRAAQLGLKTAVVERQYWGGVCLNVGCIPSKALLRNAEIARLLRSGGKEFGFKVDNVQLDFAAAVKRSRQVSDRLVKGVGFLMRKNNITQFNGTGVFQNAHELEVTSEAGEKQGLRAKNVIVATGARARSIPGVTIDGKKVLTYTEAILQESQPKSVIIAGASAIGVEFATIWRSYGVDVTIVEMLERVVPLEDEEISAELGKQLGRSGIKVKTSAKLGGVDTSGAGVKVKVSGPNGEETLEAEQLLMAIGVQPNSDTCGLDALGVRLSERGRFVEIDDRMSTSVPGVYAIGDVTGKLMLAHVGSAMGIAAAETIAGHTAATLDYVMMPRATYSHPQVASFGYTEKQAAAQGYTLKVGKFAFQPNGKALGLGESTGFVKLIADAQYGELLGAHLIGPEVTELLPELTLARSMELTAEEIARNVHAHPTLSEVLMEAAHDVLGHSIHK
jgi:dihydrolipoamide dehydrogenase